MKKIILFTAIGLALSGCSKDEPKRTVDNVYISAVLKWDSDRSYKGKGPEGTVALFYLDNKHLRDLTPYHTTLGAFLVDVNDDYVFPEYEREITSSKVAATGLYENSTTFNLFPSQVLNYDPDGTYLVVCCVNRTNADLMDMSNVGMTISYTEAKFSVNQLKHTLVLFPDNANLGGFVWDKW